jgi:serine/threonine-protein kinase RsbW
MAEPPNVLLDLTNRAENVLLVREMLRGVAEAVDLGGAEFNDLRTAVTEACNNVVLHAYEGEEGPLEVEVRLQPEALEVVVRDRGIGIEEPGLRTDGAEKIGLTVIGTLTKSFELRDATGGGTEVRMEFLAPGTSPPGELFADGHQLPLFTRLGPSGTTAVSIAPVEVARSVLPRLLSALAARAHFSTDRISDLQLMSDALVAHASGSITGSHLGVAVNVEPRNLELHIGPLGPGSAQRLIGDSKIDGLGRVIEKLADRHRVAMAGSYEVLTLELAGRR